MTTPSLRRRGALPPPHPRSRPAAASARRPRRRAIAALCALLFVGTACFAGVARADAPLSVLEPGFVGFGLTAGHDGIERFPVTVLGLQYDPAGGFPLVLIRAEGPFIEAAGGVAAGMSGSPVYVNLDGRDELIGAIGYVFPEADHSLALVTPAEPMRALLREARGGAPGRPSARATALAPFGPPLASLGPARPVAAPVLIAGLSPRAAARLEPLFAETGARLLPLQGGAGGETPDAPYRLEPGAAVSVQLARGDVTVAAIGTLTLLENGQLLAFGHPLLGIGPVEYALAPAFVTALVPSSVVPFKLANSGAEVLGTVRLDRRAALAGDVAGVPDLLPMPITLQGPQGRAELSVELARHDRLTPALAAATVLQALDEARGATRGGSATLAWQITLGGGERLTLRERTSDPADLATAVARLAAEPVGLLAGNRFADPDLERVALLIEYGPEIADAEIVDVEARRRELAPGATAELFVRLQPYRAPSRVETITVPLPVSLGAELEAGDEPLEVRLLVRGGNVPRPVLADERRGADDPPILSFSELLDALRLDPRGDEIVVEVVIDDEWRRLERLELPFALRGREEIVLRIAPPDEGSSEVPEVDPAPGSGDENGQ